MSTQKDSLQGALPEGGPAPLEGRSIKPGNVLAGALEQLRTLWKLLLLLYVPILLLFIALKSVTYFSDQITLSYLTRDVTAIAKLPFFAGFISQLGGLLWAAGLAICLFTLFVLAKQPEETAATRRLLLQGAILTGMLVFDDMFQFHEEIGEDYLGISEKVTMLGLGLLALIFLFSNLKEILNSEYLLLGLALGLFGSSAFLDATNFENFGRIGRLFSDQLHTFAEDSLKFAGIVTWLVYFARFGYHKIRGLLQS